MFLLNRYSRPACALLLALLTACATQQEIRAPENKAVTDAKAMIADGRIKEGIAQLEQEVKAQPENVELRSYTAHQRDIQVAKLVFEADTLRQQANWDEAEADYRRVLIMDAQNQRATEGLRLLAVGRKHANMLAQALQLLKKQDTDGAQNIAREVLAEDADDANARKLYESIERKRIAKVTETPQLHSAFKKPITLEFKDIPLKSVFEFISKAADINFIYDKDLSQDQKISIFVRNTSIDDALQVILTSNQLEKKILNDNTLLIYPASRSQEYQELYVRSFYLGNTDAKRMLNLIKTVVKTRDVYIDEKLNTLVMRDTPDNIHIAEKLITSQDLPDPEVMLEVEVMEVNRNTLEAIGVQYPNKATLGVHGATATSNLPGVLTGKELTNFNGGLAVFSISDPALTLDLLNQNSDTNLLANPHIRVKNREKASIHIGDKLPVITSTAGSTGFVSESVNYIDVGINLDVEPTILLADEVSIKVALEVSNQTNQLTTSSGTVTYTLGSRHANTVLRLKNGETQVLAGLFRDDAQDTVNKVPWFSKLPLLGGLFSDNNANRMKKEIVLLITPRILSNIVPPDAAYTIFPSGIDKAPPAGSAKASKQDYAPPPQPAPVVQTPQEVQIGNVEHDRAFANSMTQP